MVTLTKLHPKSLRRRFTRGFGGLGIVLLVGILAALVAALWQPDGLAALGLPMLIGAVGTKTALFSRQQPGGVFTIEDQGESTGNRWFVCSTNGVDGTGYGRNPDAPFATLDYAIGMCEADKDDIIYVMPGHTETWTTTGTKITFDVAGVKVIGLGTGADRPTFSFGHTGTALALSAAGVTLKNLLFVAAVDSVLAPLTISGPDCTLDGIEWRDTTDIEFVRGFITTAAADRLSVENCFYNGYTAGDACVNFCRLVGVNGALFANNRYVGIFTTGVIEFHTTLNTNVISLNDTFLVTGTVDLSKNIVATIANNTWFVAGYDLAAGCGFSGGSGAAVQKDDVGAITALIGTLTNTGGTATLGGILGDVANSDIATRLTAIKTMTDKVGTITNTGGTASIGGVLGDVANTSIATRLTNILAAVGKPGAFAWGACDVGMAASATTIVSAALVGYGNDFFNTRFFMQVIKNANSAGNAPEGEIRQITDYVSATGTFTVTAFSANVEENDVVLIFHLVQMMVQTPNSGTATAGAAGNITLAAAASATNNLYNGSILQILSGTGAGQVRLITAYNGGTKVATIAPNWATNPDNTSVYVIHPAGTVRIDAITDGLITAGTIATDAIDADALAADALAEIADAVADEAVAGHATAATVGAMLQTPHSGTATAGAAGNITLAATASATNNLYNACLVQLIGGTGVGQVRLITAYDGGTKVATVAPNWATNPANDSVYVIRPVGSARIDAITAGIIAAASFAAGAVDATALGADAITNAKIADNALSEEQFDADAAARLMRGIGVDRNTADVITGAATGIFTIAGGRVLITELFGEVTTQIGAGATNTKFQANPTTGTTTDMCTTSDIDGDEVGSLYGISGTPGDAMLVGSSGSVPGMLRGVVVNVGQIEFFADADRAGSIKFHLRYIPLDTGATVVAA